ncbi:hypothetical protein C1646_719235 [Rhizophagus diaphanus]|nr:hypothetical protein C1646_719235 [Rhizophagus diaphanus] [Rhizophagus sp. MUCL 43196]
MRIYLFLENISGFSSSIFLNGLRIREHHISGISLSCLFCKRCIAFIISLYLSL